MDCVAIEECAPRMLEVCTLEQIAAGQGRCFITNDLQIAVFRLRDGRVFALDNICPHRAGPLSEGIIGVDHASRVEAVVCPLHAYKFSLRDGRGLDTELLLRSFPVEVRDGRVFVGLPQER